MFLCLTERMEERERRKISGKVMLATFFVCLVLLFLGRVIFSVFGITLDAFRVGVGTILLLSGIGLVLASLASQMILSGISGFLFSAYASSQTCFSTR